MFLQFFIVTLSALFFFGFVALGVKKFGLLSCYSAYAPCWDYLKPNPWQLVTIFSAFLLVPVLLEGAKDSIYQCFGFLAPMFLTFVGATPDYQKDKVAFILHQIGAWGTVAFVIAYSFIFHLTWIILAIFVVAMIVAFIQGFKKYWMFWGEMAMYLSLYLILYVII